jgi:hypothetical protein
MTFKETLYNIKQFSNMPSFQSYLSISADSRLAASIEARGFLAPTTCSFCSEISRLCHLSLNSSRCSNCVLHHRSCSHTNDIGRIVFLQELQRLDLSIVEAESALDNAIAIHDYSYQQMMTSVTSAYQAFVAVQRHVSQLQDLRRQRNQFSPVGTSDDDR